MTIANKNIKGETIAKAAEEVFFSVGYENAKMEAIAKVAGYSKVTVYSYFGSKENLYMALSFRAIQHLIDKMYDCLEKTQGKNGLDTFMALTEVYLEFCSSKRNYVDLMLNYLSIVRRTVAGEQLNQITAAMQNSIYYRKIRNIQNVTINLTVEEIQRGQRDGSILSKRSPWVIHHMMWSMITGYAKVNYQPAEPTFINADNEEWKAFLQATIRSICLDKIEVENGN